MTNNKKEVITVLTVFKENGKYGMAFSGHDTNMHEVLGFLTVMTNKMKKDLGNSIGKKTTE